VRYQSSEKIGSFVARSAKLGKGEILAQKKTSRINRRDFLRLSGVGLSGAVLLGVAGCGGGETI
jgi:hypothetical protein